MHEGNQVQASNAGAVETAQGDRAVSDTPTLFLTTLSETLKSSAEVDQDLAGILADHLLTVSPDATAVANAKAAIVALALKRAKAAPASEVAIDG
jgi:hypothetical protein